MRYGSGRLPDGDGRVELRGVTVRSGGKTVLDGAGSRHPRRRAGRDRRPFRLRQVAARGARGPSRGSGRGRGAAGRHAAAQDRSPRAATCGRIRVRAAGAVRGDRRRCDRLRRRHAAGRAGAGGGARRACRRLHPAAARRLRHAAGAGADVRRRDAAHGPRAHVRPRRAGRRARRRRREPRHGHRAPHQPRAHRRARRSHTNHRRAPRIDGRAGGRRHLARRRTACARWRRTPSCGRTRSTASCSSPTSRRHQRRRCRPRSEQAHDGAGADRAALVPVGAVRPRRGAAAAAGMVDRPGTARLPLRPARRGGDRQRLSRRADGARLRPARPARPERLLRRVGDPRDVPAAGAHRRAVPRRARDAGGDRRAAPLDRGRRRRRHGRRGPADAAGGDRAGTRTPRSCSSARTSSS